MRLEDEFDPRYTRTAATTVRKIDVEIPVWKGIAAVVVGTLLIMLALYQLTEPVRIRLSERYEARGDQLLIVQDYEGARREYGRALVYNSGNSEAKEREAAAGDAPTDPAVLRGFFQEHKVSKVTAKLDTALQTFGHPKDALTEGVKLYAAKDYVYARYPLEQAVKLDPEYAEAWHYLGLTYDELAKQRAEYKKKSEEALAKRDKVSPVFLSSLPANK